MAGASSCAMDRITAGLSPAQTAFVVGAFMLSAFFAFGVAFALRRWNRFAGHRRIVRARLAEIAAS